MSHITIQIYTVDSETGERHKTGELRRLEGVSPEPFVTGRKLWPACECPLHR